MRQLECDNGTSNALEVVAAARKGSWRRLLVDAVAEGIRRINHTVLCLAEGTCRAG